MNTLRSHELRQALVGFTCANAGHNPEHYREYLGMSQIYRAEEELIQMMRQGHMVWEPSQEDLCRMSWGPIFEAEMKWRLASVLDGMGAVVVDHPEEIVAAFDGRFRGHPDMSFEYDGLQYVVDVKSTFDGKLCRIIEEKRLPNSDYLQMQMYVHHGRYDLGYVVYVARDTGRMWVHHVTPSLQLIDRLNEKAQRVLGAVSAKAA